MADNSFKIRKGLTINPMDSAPANPVSGDIYYDSSLESFVYYTGSAWASLTSVGEVTSSASMTSSLFIPNAVKNAVLRLTGAGGDLHGMSASFAGKKLVIYNASSGNVIVKHDSVSELTENNRIHTPSSADMTLVPGEIAQFIYDVVDSKWLLVSVGSGAGAYLPATDTTPGIVKLNNPAVNPTEPEVPSLNVIGEVTGNGLTRVDPGVLRIGMNEDDESIEIGHSDGTTTVHGEFNLSNPSNTNIFSTKFDGDNLLPHVGQKVGSDTYNLVKGYQTGTCRDGDTVTFPTSYPVDGNVQVSLKGGIISEPRNAQWLPGGTGPHSDAPISEHFEAPLVISGGNYTGFTCNAKLRSDAASAVSESVPPVGAQVAKARQNWTSPVTNTAVSLDVSSQSTDVLGVNYLAQGNEYRLYGFVRLRAWAYGGREQTNPTPPPVIYMDWNTSTSFTVTTAIQVNNTGTWVTLSGSTKTKTLNCQGLSESSSSEYTATTLINYDDLFVVPGAVAGTQFRLIVTDARVTISGSRPDAGNYGGVSISSGFYGEDATNAVFWTRNSDTKFATKTPRTSDFVTWEAWLY